MKAEPIFPPKDAGAEKGLGHCELTGALGTWDPNKGVKGRLGGRVRLPRSSWDHG